MPATKPRVRSEVTVVEIDGEAVVYEPERHRLHYLNHSAALVLDLCDGNSTMKQMSEAIADVFEMPVVDVEKRVRTTVRELRDAGLLEPLRRVAEAPSEAIEEAEADEREEIRIQVPRSS